MNINGTPITDALVAISAKMKHSFHSLPLQHGNSIIVSPTREKYLKVLGSHYLDHDLTVTGELFDSFFFPKSCIKESEALTAKLFGADGSLYITTGTTTSNQIAISALYQNNGAVLIDKNCHQSIHFALDSIGANVVNICPEIHCKASDRHIWKISRLIQVIKKSRAPFELIVLTAQSYDGVIYNIPKILERLLDAGVKTRKFLIDEAWGALNYFNSNTAHATALNINALLDRYPDLELICTHSAHKSLSALRQASILHYRGSKNLRNKIEIAKFRTHCTSPSYPILASLDLAQSQMQIEGVGIVKNLKDLTRTFNSKLLCIDGVNAPRPIPLPDLGEMSDFILLDPFKISLDVSRLTLSPAEIQKYLFQKHGVYLNRLTESSILINFHIGITALAVDDLLAGITEISSGSANPSKKLRLTALLFPIHQECPYLYLAKKSQGQLQIKYKARAIPGLSF